MNRTLSTIAAGAMLAASTAAPAAAQDDPNKVVQLCVDFQDAGDFTAFLAEDYATWEAVRGHRIAYFVAVPPVQGCAALQAGDGFVFDGPNPWPAPVTEPPACEPAERVVQVERVVYQDAPATLAKLDKLGRKIERQAARIAKLRAKLEAKR